MKNLTKITVALILALTTASGAFSADSGVFKSHLSVPGKSVECRANWLPSDYQDITTGIYGFEVRIKLCEKNIIRLFDNAVYDSLVTTVDNFLAQAKGAIKKFDVNKDFRLLAITCLNTSLSYSTDMTKELAISLFKKYPLLVEIQLYTKAYYPGSSLFDTPVRYYRFDFKEFEPFPPVFSVAKY